MSARWLIALSLALLSSWAIGVNSANAHDEPKPAKMVRVTYPVADLVIPIPGTPGAEKRKTTEETLMKLIKTNVAAKSWEEFGGEGTMQYFPNDMALIVNQRVDAQADIANLLASLRKLQEVQVSVELRFVQVSPLLAGRLLQQMDERGRPCEAGEKSRRFVSLDEKQVFALLEAVQGDRQAHVMQAPKCTLFNAQKAAIGTAQKDKSGFRCEMLPIVDPERKFVRLSLDVELAEVKAARTFVVASGRTLVWHLGHKGSAGAHLFVLATPRIMIVEEEKAVFRD